MLRPPHRNGDFPTAAIVCLTSPAAFGTNASWIRALDIHANGPLTTVARTGAELVLDGHGLRLCFECLLAALGALASRSCVTLFNSVRRRPGT